MLIVHGILAGVAVATLALGSHRALSTVLAIGAALADLALGAAVEPAVSVMAPLLVFLAAALALAALVAESGLSARLAALLVAAGHGRIATLYALVCAASAALTAAVSLDAAVVVMVPVLDNLRRTARTSFPALFLGAVAVANGASIMVPQGNPTNLVVIGSLRMSPAAFTARMLTPGLAATMICASGVAIRSRRQLGGRYRTAGRTRTNMTRDERYALAALNCAAVAGWIALYAGVPPWWPFAAVAALFVAARRRPLRASFPWRTAAQITSLVVTLQALALRLPESDSTGLWMLLAFAGAVGLAAATANNLPVSATAGGLLVHSATAYAASVGLAVGALATARGSVATLLARDLAGPAAPPFPSRDCAVIAACAIVAATILVWAA